MFLLLLRYFSRLFSFVGLVTLLSCFLRFCLLSSLAFVALVTHSASPLSFVLALGVSFLRSLGEFGEWETGEEMAPWSHKSKFSFLRSASSFLKILITGLQLQQHSTTIFDKEVNSSGFVDVRGALKSRGGNGTSSSFPSFFPLLLFEDTDNRISTTTTFNKGVNSGGFVEGEEMATSSSFPSFLLLLLFEDTDNRIAITNNIRQQHSTKGSIAVVSSRGRRWSQVQVFLPSFRFCFLKILITGLQ